MSDYGGDYSFHNDWRGREGYFGVDFIGMVGDKPVVLTEAESPSVMKMAGKLLPVNGFKLTWTHGQPLVAQLFQKASTLSQMQLIFDDSCNLIGCYTSRSKEDGVDVSFLPQLLDCLPSCQER